MVAGNWTKESKSSRFIGPKSSADESEQDEDSVRGDGLINEVCDSNDLEIESPMDIFSLVLTFWYTANDETDLWPVTDMIERCCNLLVKVKSHQLHVYCG